MSPSETPRPSAAPTLLGALFVIGAGLFVWWLFEGFLPPAAPELARVVETSSNTAQEETRTPALLVLPLAAVESPGSPGLAGGVHEALTGGLRDGSGWQVITGEASAPPGGNGTSGAGIQGVDATLSGELVQDGEGLTLTLRLTASPSGDPLWSGTYEGRTSSASDMALAAARSLNRELELYRELLLDPDAPGGDPGHPL
jgi:TolB-like protein